MASRSSFLMVALYAVAALCLTTLVHAGPIVLGNNNFDEHVKVDGKTWFVKFFAPWCGHCKRMAPAWEELANTMEGDETWRIAHVDCTSDKETCNKFEIRGYPTLKVFHDGKELKRYTGARDVDSLKTFINVVTHDLWQAEAGAGGAQEE